MSWVATYLNYTKQISVDNVTDLAPKDVDKCIEFLTQKKKAGQFRAFWDDFGQIVNLMASGEVWISDCWNPVVEAAKKSGFKGKYVNPIEGNRPWFHGIALSKDSKNADLVYEYANWSLEGWWGAQVLPTGWIPATLKAKDYLSKDVWDFWMEGKGRDTGAFVERAKNVACWPYWPKEADYYLSKWLNFLAA
jgi:spermidine/putrescine-binding protein